MVLILSLICRTRPRQSNRLVLVFGEMFFYLDMEILEP